MPDERCPKYNERVIATEIHGPSVIMIRPCGHDIGHMVELIDAPDLDPLLPDEWYTQFLADSDD
ncbi:hypothetical protein [Haladaptatus halobius]|uniref:hypothetical protein n=1 Tax=Haladaptatus halobius TaxID=2884875 RepID=UPI001D0AF5BB|nr:hypothetical protein [Haladaptatus halobius]